MLLVTDIHNSQSEPDMFSNELYVMLVLRVLHFPEFGIIQFGFTTVTITFLVKIRDDNCKKRGPKLGAQK